MRRSGAREPQRLALPGVRTLVASSVLAAALVLVLELFVPPVIGLADNGDFEKVMTYARLQYFHEAEERFANFVVTEFAVVPHELRHSGYHTSEILLVGVSRLLAAPFSRPGTFDIRALGAVQSLLLLAAIALLVAATGPVPPASRVVAAFLCVLCFTDVAYAAAFNSFLSQTASLLFLLLTAGVAGVGIARGGLSGVLLALYFLFAALFVVSKPQECLDGPLLAALGVLLTSRRSAPAGAPSGARWAAPAFAGALIALSLLSYWKTPRVAIRNVGLYHTVFMDILPESPDPGRDLDELGLDRSLLRYSGITAYVPGSPVEDPQFQKRFFDRMGYGKVLLFYARHPARFADRIRRAGPALSQMRPPLGNYEKKTGFPPGTLTKHFAWWSSMRAALGPYGLPVFSLLFAASLAAGAAGFRNAGPRERLFRTALAILVAMALLEFLVCVFADYLGDLPRHLYAFQAMADLILIADLAWIAALIPRRLSRRPAKARTA